MGLEDKTLQCVECGQNFTFTVADQEFLATKGYTHEPKRCPSCREARRSQRGFGGGGGGGRSESYSYRGQGQGPREMFPAVCASCGKETQVPFQPRQGRPVYCNDCYSRMRTTSGGRR